ncbi:alpha/beta hydrolase [Tateyamaria pelophila]|uniref:alpha/beta hydrolase n=1 Tax=Tateyamaria pelophila TaxID=328415 RepID=UPI001CBD7F55|nr:alpha/beta hydrolase [Tateyamaria pelophila]
MGTRFQMKPLIAILMVLVLTACTRAPQIIGVINPEVPVNSVVDLTKHRVFIISTREASEVVGAFFSAERAPELALASVDATIPPTHVTGMLERPEKLPPDPRTEFTVVNPIIYEGNNTFVSEVNRELAKRAPGDRRLLVFVHGFNNTASEAILRLAQFVEDTGFTGVPVLYTWASAAKGSAYVYDINSALVARSKLDEMAEILSKTKAESVDVFAHSMGTFLTMEGLTRAHAQGKLGTRTRINHIVLASPDIDIDLFQTQITELPPAILEKMYLLISKDDVALRISRRIAGGVPRVGAADVEALEAFGVTVIDLGQVSDSTSGSHSKFAGSPEVVQLIGVGLNSNRDFGASGQDRPLDELLDGVPVRIFRN